MGLGKFDSRVIIEVYGIFKCSCEVMGIWWNGFFVGVFMRGWWVDEVVGFVWCVWLVRWCVVYGFIFVGWKEVWYEVRYDGNEGLLSGCFNWNRLKEDFWWNGGC